jgi:hypothetical protein
MKKFLAAVLSASFMMLAGAAFADNLGKKCYQICSSGKEGCICKDTSGGSPKCHTKVSCHRGTENCICNQ